MSLGRYIWPSLHTEDEWDEMDRMEEEVAAEMGASLSYRAQKDMWKRCHEQGILRECIKAKKDLEEAIIFGKQVTPPSATPLPSHTPDSHPGE